MQTLESFKKSKGVDTLSFYKSNTTNRFVASLPNDEILVTTVDYDPDSIHQNVYGVTTEDGDFINVLSSKAPKAPAFSK